MALYWPEAQVAVVSEEARGQGSERDLPPEVVVILLRAGQEECPEFVSGVRELVEGRTMAHRCRTLESIYELGTEMGEPEGSEGTEGEKDEPSQAEARLRERLMETWGAERADGTGPADDPADDEDLWGWERCLEGSGVSGGVLGSLTHVGEWGAPETQVVINHCDEVVISR